MPFARVVAGDFEQVRSIDADVDETLERPPSRLLAPVRRDAEIGGQPATFAIWSIIVCRSK